MTNSADAERSFSFYSLIVRERRRFLSESFIRHLVFLCYNTRIVSGATDKDNYVEDKKELLPALRQIYDLEIE